MVTMQDPVVPPSDEESKVARESSRQLAAIAGELAGKTVEVQFAAQGQETTVALPASAVQLLLRILTEMSKGNAVTLMPIHAMLTTQEAADLLNVSRPFIVKELQAGRLDFVQVGTHRRIPFKSLLKYKEAQQRLHNQAMDELVQQAQQEGFGY